MREKRSNTYPSYAIEECILFCDTIYLIYGDEYRISREELAKAFSLSVGSIIMKTSSCVQYGLLNMKSKKGYQLTPTFLKCLGRDKRAGKLEAFQNSVLYQKIIAVFKDRKISSLDDLTNTLFHKCGISQTACPVAANVFMENARDLGILTSDGQINIDRVAEKTLELDILLKNRKTAKLVLPADFEAEDFETIITWINAMKDIY